MKRPTKFQIMRHNRREAERVRARLREESDDAYAERVLIEMQRTAIEKHNDAAYAALHRPAPRRWWWPLAWGR
jgi:hypothetical protein